MHWKVQLTFQLSGLAKIFSERKLIFIRFQRLLMKMLNKARYSQVCHRWFSRPESIEGAGWPLETYVVKSPPFPVLYGWGRWSTHEGSEITN